MAYLVKMAELCDTCGKRAQYHLYNRRNSLMGAYCTSHAKQELKELKLTEAKKAP